MTIGKNNIIHIMDPEKKKIMPYFNAIWEQGHIIAVPFFYAVEIADLLYIHNFMKLWKLKQAI